MSDDGGRLLMARSLLLAGIMLGISGCLSPESIDLNSFDPVQDQQVIARYYRNQAMAMREKSDTQTIAAARYEALFGAEADLVSGAKSLSHYYARTAEELERIAQAHETVERKKRTPAAVR